MAANVGKDIRFMQEQIGILSMNSNFQNENNKFNRTNLDRNDLDNDLEENDNEKDPLNNVFRKPARESKF
jgi:hypothetical protein